MADLAYATFGSIPNLTGGTLTMIRGVKPSRCLLRRMPADLTVWTVNTLTLHYGSLAPSRVGTGPLGSTSVVTLPNCAVVETRNRHWHARDGWRQDIVVCDRRWKWRYVRVDGVYNERTPGFAVQDKNKKTIKQLMEICLDALGETSYVTDDVPVDVYPPAIWNRARADLELQWLCDLVGMVVCYDTLTNTIKIKKLNDTTGSSLPSETFAASPAQRYKPSVMPAHLRVQGNPTIIQSELTLEAVGLDVDGSIVPIDDLTYKPAGGWEGEWPTIFDGVDAANRDLALATVFRWYRPASGWEGDGVTITDATQLELLEYSAEGGEDEDGYYRPIPPLIKGVHYELGDLNSNSASSVIYAGDFKVRPEKCLVEFSYPVFKLTDATAIAQPELTGILAYRVRKSGPSGTESSDGGYAVYQRNKDVSSATTTTDYRVLCHPELTKVKIVDEIYSSAGDNSTALNAEADSYLDRVEATYDFEYCDERVYVGIWPQATDGAIAQVQWWWGHGRPALTRIGRFTEFDPYTLHHQQRRMQERVAQMAERFSL